jgi:hypothetical protein
VPAVEQDTEPERGWILLLHPPSWVNVPADPPMHSCFPKLCNSTGVLKHLLGASHMCRVWMANNRQN